jgi:ATP-dependent DNA helicase DinG
MIHHLHSDDVLAAGGLIAQQYPGYQEREPQMRFAGAIDEAIMRGAKVISELGTGTGKSYAYLIPGLLAHKRMIVTTTVKSLQEQLVGKDLPFLASVLKDALGRTIRFVYLKGKGNYVCHTRVAKLAGQMSFETPEAAADWARFDEWYKATATGDMDEINPPLHPSLREQIGGEDCAHKGCPAAQAKEAAKTADVVVANHALTILDAMLDAQTEGHARVLPEAEILVMDEAHGLVGVAQNILGYEVSLGAWNRTLRRFVRLGGSKWDADAQPIVKGLERWGENLVQRMAQGRERQIVLGDERPFAAPLVEALGVFEAEARQNTPVTLDADDKTDWLNACEAVMSFARRVDALSHAEPGADPDAWVRYASQEGAGRRTRVVLQGRPVDVSAELRRMIWDRYPVVVATSATLTSPPLNGTQFAFFRAQTGVPADAEVAEVVAPSPFPYERNSTLYVPAAGVITADKRREPARFFDQTAREVERLVKASGGRAFCLFTSVNAMREVAERVIPTLPAHWRIFVQGDASRTHIVDEFRREDLLDSNPAVLFGTRTFFEGVDIPGRALELVILDALPFPVPSEPVYAAQCRRLGRGVRDPREAQWAHFFPLTLPMVATVLKQVAGRLIRRDTDRGVVAVLDRRIVEKGYGKTLLKALPPMPLTEDFRRVAGVFARG